MLLDAICFHYDSIYHYQCFYLMNFCLDLINQSTDKQLKIVESVILKFDSFDLLDSTVKIFTIHQKSEASIRLPFAFIICIQELILQHSTLLTYYHDKSRQYYEYLGATVETTKTRTAQDWFARMWRHQQHSRENDC